MACLTLGSATYVEFGQLFVLAPLAFARSSRIRAGRPCWSLASSTTCFSLGFRQGYSLRYCCVTAALLLFYCCLHIADSAFTTASLLLHYCLLCTPALLLLTLLLPLRRARTTKSRPTITWTRSLTSLTPAQPPLAPPPPPPPRHLRTLRPLWRASRL